jgi:formylglycine-generating enzyme required for sulfatase activity
VPGGTFLRSYDGVTHNDASGEATVSDFKLDDYEITVGRFRAYVDAYPGNKPEAGEGKNPNNATDPGWDAAWNSNVGKMPATQAALVTSINCQSPTQRSWTDAPGANENRAMDCLTWYDVFAFCIWDGGRTPTEAEWNYAAAGGDQQRFYAFSNPATSTAIDATKAVFDMPSGTAADVGSKPLGNGRWGHADLNGNVYEWVLDRYHDPYAKPCKDCADTTSMDAPVMRGGSFIDPPSSLNNSFRNGILETAKVIYIGGRCARSP